MLPSLIIRRSTTPFDVLADMRREMDRLSNAGSGATMWSVPAEVRETDTDLLVDIEVPGLRPEDIELTIEDNVLTVSGERKMETEENTEGEYHVFERRYGRFERSFAIPQRVDASGIEATSENGVLSIRLPKAEEAKPRRIEVRTNGARQIEDRG